MVVAWVERDQILSPKVAHESSGNIKDHGNDSCGSIISFREPSVSPWIEAWREPSDLFAIAAPHFVRRAVQARVPRDSSFSFVGDTSAKIQRRCSALERTISFICLHIYMKRTDEKKSRLKIIDVKCCYKRFQIYTKTFMEILLEYTP